MARNALRRSRADRLGWPCGGRSRVTSPKFWLNTRVDHPERASRPTHAARQLELQQPLRLLARAASASEDETSRGAADVGPRRRGPRRRVPVARSRLSPWRWRRRRPSQPRRRLGCRRHRRLLSALAAAATPATCAFSASSASISQELAPPSPVRGWPPARLTLAPPEGARRPGDQLARSCLNVCTPRAPRHALEPSHRRGVEITSRPELSWPHR